MANAAQLQAIEHMSGPAMVLAGPGSGKTKVIVERVRRLIEKGTDPGAILVITFTKAAALEMQYRFLKITDSSYPEVSFGTFHSIFYQIIRSNISEHNSKLEIANESFKYEIIRDILSDLKDKNLMNNDIYDQALVETADIISEISRIKNMAISSNDCRDNLCVKDLFSDIFDGYNRRLKEFEKIDFDDMICLCYEVLLNNTQTLSFWQKKYEYILIDEYQDINPMQYKVIRLIAGEKENIFAVGDDDQSIYGFRGSDPGIMLRFKDDFEHKDPVMINLNINYRCGRYILENALKVIEVNTVRYKKSLVAFPDNGSGKVIARRYENRIRQSDAMAFFLNNHKEELNDIAVLTRTNSEGLAISKALNEYGIPTNLDSIQKSIYDDRAVILCLNYLSFSEKGFKRNDFLKIMNKPMRYISRDSVPYETVREKDILNYYRGNEKRKDAVKALFKEINMISHLRPSLSVRYIRKNIGIDKLFPKSKDSLDELEKKAAKYLRNEDLIEYIKERVDAEKDEKKSSANTGSKNCVKIMTMHGSKGLEFKTVWIPDLNEGIIPSRSATAEGETEEERRMLYVAMTRAKKALIMSYITGNKENPMLPSRFLRPIKGLWDENYSKAKYQTSSDPSSGRSMSSSNSTSSR